MNLASIHPHVGRNQDRIIACRWISALFLLYPLVAFADSNITLPIDEIDQFLSYGHYQIIDFRDARAPGEIARRVTLRTDSGGEIEAKLRPAATKGDIFNNVPRYEIAAYRLQMLYLDPDDYVVPPTAFRSLPIEEYRDWDPTAGANFLRQDADIFFILQYWLQNVTDPPDPYDELRFNTDPLYARHLADLNILTYLIKHNDANRGNILMSTDVENPRVFAVDNGVAFGAGESEQGRVWRYLRISRVPSNSVTRLRTISKDDLRRALQVVSQHQLVDGHYRPVELTAPLAKHKGTRFKGDILQLGLTRNEIGAVYRRMQSLLKKVDKGKLDTF